MHLLVFCSVLRTRSSSYVSGQALTFLDAPVIFLCVSDMQLSSHYKQYYAHHENGRITRIWCCPWAAASGEPFSLVMLQSMGLLPTMNKNLLETTSKCLGLGCHAFDSRLNIEPHCLPQSTETPKFMN
jgi:hypothetical protein